MSVYILAKLCLNVYVETLVARTKTPYNIQCDSLLLWPLTNSKLSGRDPPIFCTPTLFIAMQIRKNWTGAHLNAVLSLT